MAMAVSSFDKQNKPGGGPCQSPLFDFPRALCY
jgi:hypothetical protein